MVLQKMLQNATYFAYNELLWGLPSRDLHFYKALVELMLSYN